MMDDIKNNAQSSEEEEKEDWSFRDIISSSKMNRRSFDYEFPKTFEGFGYKFNEFGQLQHITTGAPFNFDEKENDHVYNQKRYEALGELVTDYVYSLLTEVGLKKLTLPLDANATEPTTMVFHSSDAFTNEKLIILIHGSGVVRAGQWARRLIINDNLNTGTQLPFIKRAIGLGFGVLVLNTNDNRREIEGEIHEIRGSETPENHANYVWSKLILAKAAAKYIAIIAHSYGGVVTVNMCETFPESFQKRVMAIAFTDSPHSLVSQSVPHHLIQWLREVARNWVSNSKPLDSPVSINNPREMDLYSAGTQRHDMTSWMCFSSIYQFIDSRHYRALMAEKLNEL